MLYEEDEVPDRVPGDENMRLGKPAQAMIKYIAEGYDNRERFSMWDCFVCLREYRHDKKSMQDEKVIDDLQKWGLVRIDQKFKFNPTIFVYLTERGFKAYMAMKAAEVALDPQTLTPGERFTLVLLAESNWDRDKPKSCGDTTCFIEYVWEYDGHGRVNPLQSMNLAWSFVATGIEPYFGLTNQGWLTYQRLRAETPGLAEDERLLPRMEAMNRENRPDGHINKSGPRARVGKKPVAARKRVTSKNTDKSRGKSRRNNA